jgi:hypothetical protein
MDSHSKFVFRSKPPRITLGGYNPPAMKVKPWEVPVSPVFKDTELLLNIRDMTAYEKRSKTNFEIKQKFPIAVIPFNLGNTQARFLHKPEIMAISAGARVHEIADPNLMQGFRDKDKGKTAIISELARPVRPSTAATHRPSGTARPTTARSSPAKTFRSALAPSQT